MTNELRGKHRWRLAGSALLVALAAGELAAQDGVRAWGSGRFASDAFHRPVVHLDAYASTCCLLHNDGRVQVIGATTLPDAPPAPTGTPYTQVAVGMSSSWTPVGFALLTNGSIVSWGANGTGAPAPALPPNTTYTQVSCSDLHALALRSDGVAVAWGNNSYGQTTLPAVPAGVLVQQVHASYGSSLLLLGNGTILTCGTSPYGPTTVPALPAGTTYTEMWGGPGHAIARRSDGAIVAWGNNTYGQCNVPATPAGVSNTMFALGARHTLASRSDGSIVAWGDDGFGQSTVPPLPAATIAQIDAGAEFSIARFTNGAVVGWGQPGSHLPPPDLAPGERWAAIADGSAIFGLTSAGRILAAGLPVGAPPTPPGIEYTGVVGSAGHFVALRSDGRAIAWGNNNQGQCAIPPLPPGMTYTSGGTVSYNHTLLLRSDGALTENGSAGTIFTYPPPGLRFVQVAGHDQGRILLLSDGQVVVTGGTSSNPLTPPTLPPGVRFVAVARTASNCAALRSDGEIAVWGYSFAVPLPPLPPHVVYVEIAGSTYEVLARRSDGRVVCGASVSYAPLLRPPEPGPGESFVELAAGTYGVVRVGPTSTYASFANGCAGTRSASRLVPRDTPRLGSFHFVQVFDLPQDAAVMVFGWNRTAPVPLAAYGMPGCSQHITADASVLLVGQDAQARYWLGIPSSIGLVGLHFHNQAIVFDPAANAAGAVVSDAAEGVIGSW